MHSLIWIVHRILGNPMLCQLHAAYICWSLMRLDYNPKECDIAMPTRLLCCVL